MEKVFKIKHSGVAKQKTGQTSVQNHLSRAGNPLNYQQRLEIFRQGLNMMNPPQPSRRTTRCRWNSGAKTMVCR